jgi:hypothetical protein
MSWVTVLSHLAYSIALMFGLPHAVDRKRWKREKAEWNQS